MVTVSSIYDYSSLEQNKITFFAENWVCIEIPAFQ